MDLSKEGTPEHTIFAEKVDQIRTACSSNGSKEMVLHIGELDQNQVNTISSIVETQMVNIGVSKGVIKRIFNIAIETLQNICFHAERDNNGNQMTYFIIGRNDQEFTIYSGNLLPNENADILVTRLERLKSLDEANLKKEYLEVLSNGELSQKGGAGLGFITIAMKSNNNIDFQFQKLNNKLSLFSMKAIVTQDK
ncbi:MAG: SiaB family protein kinase [Bacteroidota bacterium]